MRAFFLLSLCSSTLFGQISFGILGGVPFNDLTNKTAAGVINTADSSGRYSIGPTIQVGLPLGFRVEADALYRPVGYDLPASALVPGQNVSGAQWRFPVLLQYRFSAPIVKPFVEAGYSYDHIDIQPKAGSLGVNPPSITSQHGFVIGAGLDFKIPFVRISPEIRYTRDAGAPSILNSNQAEFLIGVRF